MTMTDYARAMESLAPDARFKGTVKDNTRQQFEAIEWVDQRKQPTITELEAEDARLAAADVAATAQAAVRARVAGFQQKAALQQARAMALAAQDSEAVAEIDAQIAAL